MCREAIQQHVYCPWYQRFFRTKLWTFLENEKLITLLQVLRSESVPQYSVCYKIAAKFVNDCTVVPFVVAPHCKFVVLWKFFEKPKMKIAVTILLLAIAVICASAQHNTTWGDVVNTRILAEERVDVKPTWMRVKERTVSYRSVRVDCRIDFNLRKIPLFNISICYRTDPSSYEGSCTWIIIMFHNRAPVHRSPTAELACPLLHCALCHVEVMESIQLSVSTAEKYGMQGVEMSWKSIWKGKIQWINVMCPTGRAVTCGVSAH